MDHNFLGAMYSTSGAWWLAPAFFFGLALLVGLVLAVLWFGGLWLIRALKTSTGRGYVVAVLFVGLGLDFVASIVAIDMFPGTYAASNIASAAVVFIIAIFAIIPFGIKDTRIMSS